MKHQKSRRFGKRFVLAPKLLFELPNAFLVFPAAWCRFFRFGPERVCRSFTPLAQMRFVKPSLTQKSAKLLGGELTGFDDGSKLFLRAPILGAPRWDG